MANFEFFSKRSGSKLTVGIELRDTGFAVCVCKPPKAAGQPELLQSLYKHNMNTPAGATKNERFEVTLQFVSSQLPVLIEELGLKGQDCHVVLNVKDYQLLLIESPDVPDQEQVEAVRWKVKDLSSVPLETASIAIFDLPASKNRMSKKMLYVVIVDKEKLKKLVEVINASSLNLVSIDIAEMALRNLTCFLTDTIYQTRGIAVLRLMSATAHISVFSQRELYLSRQFKIDYGAGLLDDLPEDNIALEVQRSLDYFERQMGQAQPAVLFVCGDSVTEEKLSETFKKSLAIPITWFDPQAIFNTQASIDASLIQLNIASLGASLRAAASSIKGGG